METSVIIDLHEQDTRVFQVFLEGDYAAVEAVWEREDPHLIECVAGSPFDGVRRYVDLTPFQYRTLITQAMDRINALPEGEFTDEHPLFARLRFFLAGLVLKMRDALDMTVDAIRVQWVGTGKVDFRFDGSQTVCLDDDGFEIGERPAASCDVIRLVVDNTREDEP